MDKKSIYLACLIAAAPAFSLASAASPQEGPAVKHSSSNGTSCAEYGDTSEFHLYRDRIFAFQDGRKLAVEGLPKGFENPQRKGEQLLKGPFKACVKPLSSSPVSWVDQSCLAKAGLCLPPRGFKIANGKTNALDGAESSTLFMAGIEGRDPGTQAPADPWAINFKPQAAKP